MTLYLSYRKNQNYRQKLQQLEKEIDQKEEEANYQNLELEAKSISLDLLNKKLVSEMAEREKIEKSSFARDRFLATMSNEMRTPLNVITGLTHVLLKAKPREDQVEHLRTCSSRPMTSSFSLMMYSIFQTLRQATPLGRPGVFTPQFGEDAIVNSANEPMSANWISFRLR
ncbi:MAG: histidine kinase dimerization/phospho-acceptor domain-containing protein [Saprospiraceae bacterium]